MSYETEYKRGFNWNVLWWLILVLPWIHLGNKVVQRGVRSNLEEVRVISQPNGDLRIGATLDGPFVITHLAYRTAEDGIVAIAPLTPPLAHVESMGPYLRAIQFQRLKWVDRFGDTASPPPPSAPLQAMYYKTQLSPVSLPEFDEE